MPSGTLDKYGFGYKVYFDVISGPTAYTTGGFSVSVPGAKRILAAVVMYVGGLDYLAQVNDTFPVSGNSFKVLVRENIEQTVNEGGTATYTIGGEVANGTDLSALNFVVIAIYE